MIGRVSSTQYGCISPFFDFWWSSFSTYDQGWVGWFCQKMIDQKYSLMQGSDIPVLTVSGSGKQVRDVLHASDLVHLYKAAFIRREQCSGIFLI